jgi:hypothetical protein
MLTFEQFKRQLDSAEKPKEWRYGQFVFNFLLHEHPKLANHIRGGKYDMFYKKPDDIDWEYLENNWNEDFK